MHNFIISGFSDEIDEKVESQFDFLNILGIKYFEARGINGKNISELSNNEVNDLLKSMEKHDIAVSSIGSPIGKIRIEEDFDSHFEKFKRVVEISKKLHSRYIRIFSFYMPENENSNKYLDQVIFRLEKMIKYAKQYNIILLHENEKGIYGDTLENCQNLFERLYCDNFKAVFDPANFVQCGQNTKKCFDVLHQYVEYIHIKDSNKDGTVVPAGQGDGNIEYILKTLKETNYSGYLSLEPHLGSFSGLEKLEAGNHMTGLEKSSGEKFRLAYNSLKSILERI